MIDPAIEARTLSAFGVVHGVHAHSLTLEDRVNAPLRITLRMSCWSPTLHRASATCIRVLPAGMRADDHRLESEIGRKLSPVLDLQRARAAQGLAMGTAVPFDIFASGVSVMGHVRLDRGLATILGDPDVSRDRLKTVSDSIVDLHRNDSYDGGRAIWNDDFIEDCTYRSMVRLGGGVLYDGRDLSIEGYDPPETLRHAVVGRRLCEVVEVPAVLRDHVIERWSDDDQDPGWTVMRVTPDLVRLDSLAEFPTGEAA